VDARSAAFRRGQSDSVQMRPMIVCGQSALSPNRTVLERRFNLHRLSQMVQRGFRMGRYNVGVALLALINRFVQMFDRFC
jgi:hypothetical protein